ncbi:MAG: DUF3160 domain-containing protein [Myxococcales bacterium]|nr:DUF3160 domain-containing protein [Myxococcales bacterium]
MLCALALAAPLACGPSGGDESESDSDSTTAGETDTSNELEAPDVPFPEPDAWFTEVYVPVMDQATKLSPDELLAEYPAPRTLEQVSYDPLSATYLDQIAQYSGMTPEHDALLAQNGFVAVSSNKPWSFTTTYVDLYYNDLPVLVTTDSVLYALHKSFDSILLAYEREALINEVDRMLMTMHGRLGEQIAANAIPTDLLEPARDMDLYLTVGRSLLGEAPVASLYGGDTQEEVDRILEAVADEAPKPITLFGVESIYDFSQMKPRGHYEDEPELQRYFRAMMWLGRTDLPMVTFDEQQQPLFNRRGLEAAMLANMLLDEGGGRGSWKTVDDVLVRLIGERDSMNADDMTAFMADVGVGDLEGLAKASDEKLYGALIHSPYGIQRIMSQIMYTDPTDPPVVLPRVYHLMGQRFTIDSYVFNNTTYDRVQDLRTGVKVKRMLPQELDVQFVLGNNQAAHHLTADLDKYGYQGVLHEMRFLVDSHPQEFWDQSFYNGWLDAIRALNDTTYLEQQPEPMRTKAWSDKQLNTQSASWAELRHDTLLYVKQSYSGGDGCEYPEAYVEPEPAFYARMGHLGALGLELTDELAKQNINVYGVADYFTHLQQTMATLEQIAHKELEGEVLTPAEWDFLRGTIEEELVGCGQVAYDGWYGGLFYDQEKVAEFKPTVADVHTAPTDEFGNDVGWVLHGATGRPMYMVFTVQDCSGVRAYIGPVSSYHPVLTEGFQRLTDSEWGETVSNTTPARAPWVDSFVR